MLNKYHKEMLQYLSGEGVRFLVVGSYALAVHGFPGATDDIDLFVWSIPENATNLLRALDRFGTPITTISAAEASAEVFQIGVGTRRIGFLTKIDGVSFPEAYARRLMVELEGIKIPVISREDLVANKRASVGTQDLAESDRPTSRD